MKLITLLLIALTITPLIADETPSLNERVRELAQQALPFQEEEWDGDTFYDFLCNTMEHQLEPTKIRKQTTAFKLINNTPCFNDTIIHENTTWTDLNFFSGKRIGDASISSKLDRTITSLGKAQFYKMLSATTADQTEIIHRQELIKFFVQNPELSKKIREQLTEFAKVEAILFSFWQRDPIMHRIKDQYEFKDMVFKLLNDNEYFLAAKHAFKAGKTATSICTETFGITLLTLYTLSQLLPDNHNPMIEQLREAGAEYKSNNIIFSYLWHKDLRPLNFAIAAAGAYYLYTSLQESSEWLIDLALYDEVLHLKLQHLFISFNSLDSLGSTLTPELFALEPALEPLHNNGLTEADDSCVIPDADPGSKSAESSDDFEKLNSLLHSDNFAPDSNGLLVNRGKLILTYKLMHQEKDGLRGSLRALSLLDCYTSIATLINENPENYCFAQLETANTPHLLLEDFVNPIVPADKVVTNSIELGSQPARNCIITGPNAGGKSTMIKAIGINVLLAQSLGIAAARRCVLTPFSFVATYLNITDDINAGNSLFKAEVLRTHELINNMINLPAGQHGLLIFDEIFNGTTPTEGSAAAYAVAKRLGLMSNCVTVVATHFELLTKLEALPECSFKNYKVSVQINSDRSLTYPFKLSEGISKQHIAIDVLRSEGYESDILREAESLLA